jgi:hypothetical protein
MKMPPISFRSRLAAAAAVATLADGLTLATAGPAASSSTGSASPPQSPCPPPSDITPARSARSSSCRRSFPPSSAAPSCRSHTNQDGLRPEGGQQTPEPPSTSAEAIPADRIHRMLVAADNRPRGGRDCLPPRGLRLAGQASVYALPSNPM